MHKYILLNKSQPFILPGFCCRRPVSKSLLLMCRSSATKTCRPVQHWLGGHSAQWFRCSPSPSPGTGDTCNALKFTRTELCRGVRLSGIALAAQPAHWFRAPGWVSAEAQWVELILQRLKSSLLFHICGGQGQGAGVSFVLWPSPQNTSLGSPRENLLLSVQKDLYVASVSLQGIPLPGPHIWRCFKP